MAVTYGIQARHTELQLSALNAKNRQPITQDLAWLVQDHTKETIANSKEASPLFKLKAGSYTIKVSHHDHSAQLRNLELQASQRSDIVILVPAQKDPDQYHINDQDRFNAFTENKRRQLERDGQATFGMPDNQLTEPVSREEAQTQRNQLYGQQMGPKGHPLLNKPQFDGMDPQVTPKPEENQGVQLELQKNLELAMQHGHTATPTPPTGA